MKTLEFLNRLETLVQTKDYPENDLMNLFYKATGTPCDKSNIYDVMMEQTQDDRLSTIVERMCNMFYGRNPVFEEVILEEIQTCKKNTKGADEASF